MTNTELQIIRRSLFLSVKEIVEHIKMHTGRSLSVRAWQLWEAGERKVPSDIYCEMVVLAAILGRMKQDMYDKKFEKKYVYYRSFEEYLKKNKGGKVIDWRMKQACVAEMVVTGIAKSG